MRQQGRISTLHRECQGVGRIWVGQNECNFGVAIDGANLDSSGGRNAGRLVLRLNLNLVLEDFDHLAIRSFEPNEVRARVQITGFAR